MHNAEGYVCRTATVHNSTLSEVVFTQGKAAQASVAQCSKACFCARGGLGSRCLAKLFVDVPLTTTKPFTSSSVRIAVFLMQVSPNHNDKGYLGNLLYQQALHCGNAKHGRFQAAAQPAILHKIWKPKRLATDDHSYFPTKCAPKQV